MTLTNSVAALSSVAYVTDFQPSGAAMQQPSGTTSALFPGSFYKEMGPIGAGATGTATIEFTRTGTQPITYTPRVLGAGPR